MWIQTYSGVKFDFDNFTDDDLKLEDIAHSLGMQCRVRGHCSVFYSVAQHSVLVSQVAEALGGRGAGQWGLLHDAAEAYVGDIPTPMKTEEDQKREGVLMARIADKFGLPNLNVPMNGHINTVVKHADKLLLATEKRDLMPNIGIWESIEGIEPLMDVIKPISPKASVTLFHKRFKELF